MRRLQAKTGLFGLAFGLFLLTSSVIFPVSPASATLCNDGWVSPSTGQGTCSHHWGIAKGGFVSVPAKPAKAIKFSSCKTLKAKYPDGIAKSLDHIYKATLLKTPLIWPAMYNLNKKLDADGNGLICETLYVYPWLRPTPSPTPRPITSPSPTPTSSNPLPTPAPSAIPTGSKASPVPLGANYAMRSSGGHLISIVQVDDDGTPELCAQTEYTTYGCEYTYLNGVRTSNGFGQYAVDKFAALKVRFTNNSTINWNPWGDISMVELQNGDWLYIQSMIGSMPFNEILGQVNVLPGQYRDIMIYYRPLKTVSISSGLLVGNDGATRVYFSLK